MINGSGCGSGSPTLIFLSCASGLFIAVGLGLYYNWKLGLVCTALFPLLLLGTFFEMKITLGVDTVEKSAFEASAKLAIEVGWSRNYEITK